jgi:hypothetical protein
MACEVDVGYVQTHIRFCNILISRSRPYIYFSAADLKFIDEFLSTAKYWKHNKGRGQLTLGRLFGKKSLKWQKMADLKHLSGDAGIWIISNCEGIKPSQKDAMIRLLKVIRQARSLSHTPDSLQTWYLKTTEALTLCEQYLPMMAFDFIQHPLLQYVLCLFL